MWEWKKKKKIDIGYKKLKNYAGWRNKRNDR